MKTLWIATLLLVLLSYGFVDPNFPYLQNPLTRLVYGRPLITSVLYVAILALFFVGYVKTLNAYDDKRKKRFPLWIIGPVLILVFSYPALSYDIFNYILTAKVTYFYQENPYVVMPIEIANEPMLVFTRAANKLALYGPTWIALTVFPYLAGMNNILTSILSFKLFVACFYAYFAYFLYQKTGAIRQVLFFALNPLVLIETLVSGHNDIVMLALAVTGIFLWRRSNPRHKASGLILFFSSVLIKGASIALIPLFFIRSWKLGGLLMFVVFLVSPLREEMYPWYAIWWLSLLAFVPMGERPVIHESAMWLSLGLSLRYVPWIATREYGGITPVVRELITIIPIAAYGIKKLLWRRFSLQ